MKRMKNAVRYSLYILLSCVIPSCDADVVRGNKIGDKSIMTDKDGNYWMVTHSIGAHYDIQYIGDSTTYAR